MVLCVFWEWVQIPFNMYLSHTYHKCNIFRLVYWAIHVLYMYVHVCTFDITESVL